MSGGRICVNLIAGQNESEVEAEGIRYPKGERYALMEEEVSILKALWTTHGRSISRAGSTRCRARISGLGRYKIKWRATADEDGHYCFAVAL